MKRKVYNPQAEEKDEPIEIKDQPIEIKVERVEENDDREELERDSMNMWNMNEKYNCQKTNVKMMLAHAYVPWQCYDEAFSPQEALKKGTLFPSLYGVYPIPR
ncbi:spore coat associated protein CotJA [Pelosinus propionicus]|uniref:Spore coat associated protein JA (CotJA) n=1 Tax=Pelosinus propionicus DSM 13327 TaxID=1123291 RepID=A0A1I4HML8_9FIRM|nr:spore coat associated protein CotJA [Pelosinus propionicus]SFL42947.1 Spore coat associated protein JA (CotJA) [Pelosinus propionicus DSM 13327]